MTASADRLQGHGADLRHVVVEAGRLDDVHAEIVQTSSRQQAGQPGPDLRISASCPGGGGVELDVAPEGCDSG